MSICDLVVDEPGCVPLRRQSVSSPAILLLDGVLRKAKNLNQQLDQLTGQVKERSRSMVDVSDHLVTPVTARRLPDSMVCHGCHGTIGDGAHVGSATGMNLCTLQHSLSCTGGIASSDSWRGCPVG